MIKVTCQIKTYGEKATADIKVHNHWNEQAKVEIEINGERFIVLAKDIKAAVDNCTNTVKF